MLNSLPPWPPDASLEAIAELWRSLGRKAMAEVDWSLLYARKTGDGNMVVRLLVERALLLNSEGQPARAYEALQEARSLVEKDEPLAKSWLSTLAYLQGVAAMRRGENENCIECRGESSCILPIAPAAVHTNPTGSRLAIRHFTEYLARFPDDLEVRWLLNLAYMTLGEHPDEVDPRFLISLDRFRDAEFDIGKFRDIGHLMGVNRFNQAGGRDHGGLRQRRPAGPRRHGHATPRSPWRIYRNQGRRHLRGSDRVGRA